MTTMRRLIQPLVLLLIKAIASNGLYIRGADLSSSSPLDDHAASTRTRRFLDEIELQFCYDALFVADENNDKNINREEYVSIVQALGGPTVDSYNDLPIVFKSSFSILACRCTEEPNAAPDCCVGDKAKISTNGAAPGDDPTNEEEQNLYHICFLSESSVNKFITDRRPTQTPTELPTNPPRTPAPTVSPTNPPVDGPTAPPTVEPAPAPTLVPTLEPAGSPTRSPTLSPTMTTPGPTGTPTLAPTPVPTKLSPTESPSERPTFGPNPFPTTPLPTQATSGTPTTMAPTTKAPTFSPTVAPTTVPTISPTDGPTGAPSSEPTFGPTATPSAIPTMTPTISSAPTSSAAPTNLPSVTPTGSPTKTPPDAVVETNYVIAVRGGALLSEYEGDLIESMNILASQVADDIAGSSRRRLVSVSIDRPTSLAGLDPIDCPDDVESTDRCETVTALVRLFVDDAENETAAVDQYKEALNESIDSGELQEALDFVNDDSVVYIVTGRNTGRGIDGEPEETLSAGAIIGIVVVGSIGMVFISLLLARGREPREVDLSKQDDHMVDLEGIQPGASNDIMVDTSDGEGKPGKKSNKSDESSNAGDSGWSSHGGLSSLDTHSMDEESRNRTMALGGAAVASGVVAGAALVEPNSPSDSSGNLKMTYSELDDAIQKGDWAAVGVTAALLASQSYETGGSSDTHRVSLENATLNPSRAAELDRLVEAGDWEGVVAAAAKFDAQEATHHSDRSGSNPSKEGSSSDVTSGASGSVGSSNSNSLGSGSRTHFTVGTAEGTATTDSNSQSHRKLGEIRKEVDELVRQVVPEEQDNVDEMMLQFQGREEELVETLRSMQERQVVEKSRVEGQKKAKFDVREQAQSNKRELAKKATEVKDDDDENSRKREQDLKEEQEALAQAAEWEAVAQQARNQNASAANDSAAQDAADWAIAQSLNQMSTSKEEPEAFGDDDEEGSV